MLDEEFRFEEKGVIIFEYYIHVSPLILYVLFKSRMPCLNYIRQKTALIKSKLQGQSLA
jgi:hypothetical protein